MIIGLCGKKQSGKDTIAAYLVKEFGFERKAFADPLKRSVAALFDIPFHEVDKLKDDPNYRVVLGFTADLDHDERPASWVSTKTLTFREFLQRYGTESHRDIFGENFWTDLALPVQGFYPGRAIVVSDVRFRNEAERVKCLDGLVIHIKRGSLEQPPHRDGPELDHASEVMDFPELIDFTVYNDGTIDELYEEVSQILSHVDAKA